MSNFSNNEFKQLRKFIHSLNDRCDVLENEFINLRNNGSYNRVDALGTINL